ncbi:MAG: hypothetical protein Q4B10_00075 [Actinomycetaceae bacterium]|nr:hypothetical protein [Actinomycetaceae bacterium]
MPMPLPAEGIPRGIEVGRYASERAALDAVAYLAEHDYPTENLSIVGEGVLVVHDSQGRPGLGRAFISGASSGVWLGLLTGLILGMINPNLPLSTILTLSIIVLALMVGIVRTATYALGKSRSGGVVYARRIVAQTYVLVAKSHSQQAIALLARRAGRAPEPAAPTRPVRALEDANGQPKYGRRSGDSRPGTTEERVSE